MNLVKPIAIAVNKISKVKLVSGDFSRPVTILKNYLTKITGAEFDVLNNTSVNPQIVLKTVDHGVDGFLYRIYDKDIEIEAANEQAMVFAVYDFLERIVGVKYLTSNYEYIPYDANLTVLFDEYKFNPIMGYREVYYKDYFDTDFAEKHKMSSSQKRHDQWGFWCHSFETLCSPDEYFDTHPEYFSLYEGKRVGKNSELCLSNPEVLKIVIKNLEKHMKDKPDAKYWSISQNDNNAYCRCEKCQELDAIDGSPMGSILTFVNKIAEQFPDKTISTLAYWYSRKAPKVTRPRENVHIMLCNIEANRGLAIEFDERSNGTKEELLEWKEICTNVFLWDYCIQFRNLCSPFPNLRVLAPNMKFFIENNVTALFSQSNREIEGEFAALRGYMLAKLTWDHTVNDREVMEEFVRYYYCGAAKYILQYIDLMHDEMEKAGGELSIFGGPLDCNTTYLREELFDRYQNLFDLAEEAVLGNDEVLFRVRNARLPIYYAGIVLEYKSLEERLDMIKKFAFMARKTGLSMVEEWSITTDKFLTDAIAALN